MSEIVSNKVCSACKVEKPFRSFNGRKCDACLKKQYQERYPGRLAQKQKEYYAKNRERQRINHKIWYENNKEKIRQRGLITRPINKQRNYMWVIEYLETHSCVDCGETDILVLEFDHIDRKTKKYNISPLISQGRSLETIIAEIEKCVVRCANCHRRKTRLEEGSGKLLYRKKE